MEIKEQIDVLKHLSSTHRAEFNGRRPYEWKVFFTTLTFFILCASLRFQEKVHLPSDGSWKRAVWAVFLCLGVVSAVYLLRIHLANHFNKCAAEAAETALVNCLNNEQLKPNLKLFEGHRAFCSWGGLFRIKQAGLWSWLWQAAILMTFAALSAFVLASNAPI